MKGSQLKLDFRFADEMDGMELVQFVNDAHSVESDPNNEMNFRKPTEKVTIEEVEGDLVSMPVKWLVLETPCPEEAIVGAARLRYDAHRNGRVDCFSASRAGSAEARAAVLRMLLSKIETVCFNQGLRGCILEAAQWRTDLEALFSQCGYEELSGHLWPEQNQEQLLRPTMVLEFHKVFPSAPQQQQQGGGVHREWPGLTGSSGGNVADSERSGAEDSVREAPLAEDNSVEGGVFTAAVGAGLAAGPVAGTTDEIPQLLTTLFAALHAEYGSDN